MTIKVFISQPMNGKSNDEIELERKRAIEDIEEEFDTDEIIILDSFFKDAPHNAKPLWFLGNSLRILSDADIAYFCNGWEQARGCKIEHECAKEYGIKIIEA